MDLLATPGLVTHTVAILIITGRARSDVTLGPTGEIGRLSGVGDPMIYSGLDTRLAGGEENGRGVVDLGMGESDEGVDAQE